MSTELNSSNQDSSGNDIYESVGAETDTGDELRIVMSKSYHDPSSMPDKLKEEANEKAPDMAELFQEVLRENGESVRHFELDGNTLKVDNISNLTLHSFILKAAEFGKDVTFKKETTLIIS